MFLVDMKCYSHCRQRDAAVPRVERVGQPERLQRVPRAVPQRSLPQRRRRQPDLGGLPDPAPRQARRRHLRGHLLCR